MNYLIERHIILTRRFPTGFIANEVRSEAYDRLAWVKLPNSDLDRWVMEAKVSRGLFVKNVDDII